MFSRGERKIALFPALLGAIVVATGTGVLALGQAHTATGQDNTIQAESIVIEQFGNTGRSQAGGEVSESETLSLAADQTETTYTAGPFEPDFSMNAIGLKITGSDLAGVTKIVAIIEPESGEAITRALEPVTDDLKEPLAENLLVTQPVIIEDAESFQIELTLADAGATTPEIDRVEIIYLDTSRSSGAFAAASSSASTTDGSGVNIISRPEWGADEELRLDSNGNPLWPEQYVDPKVFIVHHTAGTDGGEDPAATIRAIYYWHTKVLGWGDIGYNFLIDRHGNIYKGRIGKNGVVGGHTYNSHTDTNYNPGSVGIALIGCFEQTDGACYDDQGVTPEMEVALAKLIGKKAAKNALKPKAVVNFQEQETKRISGHRDWDYTYCPGSTVQDDMAVVRDKADRRYRRLSAPAYRGRQDSVTITQPDAADPTAVLDPATLVAGEQYQVNVRYKNTGRKNWNAANTKLKIYDETGTSQSGLYNSSWPDALGKFALGEEQTSWQERGPFTFTFTAPAEPQQLNLMIKLFHGQSKVKRSNSTLSLTFN